MGHCTYKATCASKGAQNLEEKFPATCTGGEVVVVVIHGLGVVIHQRECTAHLPWAPPSSSSSWCPQPCQQPGSFCSYRVITTQQRGKDAGGVVGGHDQISGGESGGGEPLEALQNCYHVQ